MNIKLPEEDQVGFQMAPMIDIVFLLIVFFMLVANINQQQRIPLNVPVASKSTRPEDPSGRGILSIRPDGTVFAGAQEMSLDEITEMAESRITENVHFKVFLRADSTTKHKYVRDVMTACAAGGVIDIIFATYESE